VPDAGGGQREWQHRVQVPEPRDAADQQPHGDGPGRLGVRLRTSRAPPGPS
jgi:hypothetical protein